MSFEISVEMTGDRALAAVRELTTKHFFGAAWRFRRIVQQHLLKDYHFITAPGSIDKHHAYEGGLLVHTAEVAAYCDRVMSPVTVHVNLVLAAMLHDVCKTQDYERTAEGTWVKTSYYSQIRHVAGSYAYWMKLVNDYEIDAVTAQDIGHCILAHHGRKEWGSPVEPQTENALLLHQADMWSAHYGPGAWLKA